MDENALYARPCIRSAPGAFNLDQQRPDAVFDLGESVAQVKPPYFVDHLLPKLRFGLSVKAILDTLTHPFPGETSAAINDDRWSAFRLDPAHDARWEPIVFRQLDEITEVIHRATGLPDDVRTVIFRSSCAHTLSTSERDNSSRPNGFASQRDVSLKDTHWHHIAVAGEYKKRSEDASDNRLKLIWSLSRTMRDDVRRRFAFGYTIEDRMMRLWFCNRSEVIVSLPFDFIRERFMFVHFILSITYAEEADLGWDPTIVRHHNPYTKTFFYDITVHPHNKPPVTYRTKQVLANVGAEAPLGRGTRVWRARRLENGQEVGQPVAVKDGWVDSDRDREGHVHEQIRASAPEGSEAAKHFDEYLLHVECYGDVLIDGVKDQTDALHRRGAALSTEYGRLSLLIPRREGSGSKEESERILCCPAKTHHRTVFKEVGTPLHNEKSLSVVFKALRNLVYVLQSLHTCRWVHRDISSGNILLVNGRLKLTDVEYAKHEDNETVHGVRTGTPNFMSTEVDSQTYHHIPSGPSNDTAKASDPVQAAQMDRFAVMRRSATDSDESNTESIGELPVLSPASTRRQKPVVSFTYNPLHDLESVWWLALWTLIARNYLRTNEDKDQAAFAARMADQATLSKHLFYKPTNRLQVMTANRFFTNYVNALRLLLKVKWAAVKLDACRDVLKTAFASADAKISDIAFATVVPRALYDQMFDTFDLVHRGMKKYNGEVYIARNVFALGKRDRNELEAGNDRNALSAIELALPASPPASPSTSEGEERPRKLRKLNETSAPGAGPNGSNA